MSLEQQIYSASTDPAYITSHLNHLPDVDPHLSRLGGRDKVFNKILNDAHVIGEVRSIRSGVLSYEHRIVQAEATDKAFELVNEFFNSSLVDHLIWSIAEAILKGVSAVEVVWDTHNNLWLPTNFSVINQSRIRFNHKLEPRILTRSNAYKGEEIPPHKVLITTHLQSPTRPYGIALLSACFWPWMFKSTGLKNFSNYSRKYGFPWPVGKYPQGSSDQEVTKFLQALLDMIEGDAAVIPDGNSLDFHTTSTSGKPIHAELVQLCNKEISKALTSQTLASDQADTGARAASETHREREKSVNAADRRMISTSINQLIRWIIDLNFGVDSPSPKFNFYQEEAANSAWMSTIAQAVQTGLPVDRNWAADKLGIVLSDDNAITISNQINSEFASPKQKPLKSETSAIDKIIDKDINKIVEQMDKMMIQGKSIKDFEKWLAEQYSLENNDLVKVVEEALQYNYFEGIADAKSQ